MRITTKGISGALIVGLLAAFSVQAQPSRHATSYVNTFIGTAPMTDPRILGYELPRGWRSWAGLTFPGASLPNAMVQLSPMTAYGSGAGYQYEDSVILGFTHTNKGHWNLCNIPILPMSAGSSRAGSRFSHAREKASPGYYQVYLDDYQIDVSLTSTLRCGYHRYKYRNNKDRQILFDLARANSRVSGWNIQQMNDSTLQGFQGGENIYFYATLNTKIEKLTKTAEGEPSGFAVATLANGGTSPVELKIGLSFVSAENAKLNLETEIGGKSFETIREKADQTWGTLLSSIQVEGGNDKQTRMFYSCLYRSFLWPALRSDVNGEFMDVKKKKTSADFNYYTEPSLWDTYRNKDVLLDLISPQVTLDVIKSLKNVGERTGFIPTFFHGDHGASSIAGAYLRGITDFDIKSTYQLLLNNATLEGGTRPFIKEYIQKGYISELDIDSPNVETKAKAAVSKTLEYSYDDYSVAQIAKQLGDTMNYRIFMERSKNYKNVFDPSTRFMRGRLEDGQWVKNFNPQFPYYEYMYREANAWQVSFYAPHDMPGLIGLYGGPKNFEAKLDSFFTLRWNPNYIARNVETMIGQYCQGNQPDHEAPFSYIFIDKPAKSQKIIDYILDSLYGIGKKGLELSGMDDAGEMSSWYVFCAMGIYPFSATDPKYIVTLPIFSKIKWKLSNGKTLTIVRQGKSRTLASVQVNGKVNEGYFVSHDLFKTGGEIKMITK